MPIGLAGSVGSLQHLPVALTKAIGANFRDLKVVAFKGSAEAVTSVLGGHVDVVPTAGGNAAPHVATGKDLDTDYASMKTVLVGLGLAKQ